MVDKISTFFSPDVVAQLSDAQLRQLSRDPRIATLDPRLSENTHYLRWVRSFDINPQIPGEAIHQELQSLERQFREALYKEVYPRKSKDYQIDEANYQKTLKNENGNLDSLRKSSALDGTPNFVVARFGFVVKTADGRTHFKHFPIKAYSNTGEMPIFSLHHFESDRQRKYIDQCGTSHHDKMMAQYLFHRYRSGQKISGGKMPEQMALNNGWFDSKATHSEQALFLALDQQTTRQRLIEQLATSLAADGIKNFTVKDVILDGHSTRYMCLNCKKAALGLQNNNAPDGFIASLTRELNQRFRQQVVATSITGQSNLTLTTRVGASLKEGSCNTKNRGSHDRNPALQSSTLLARDMVTAMGDTALPVLGNLEEYTLFSSGGNHRKQIYTMLKAYRTIAGGTGQYADMAMKRRLQPSGDKNKFSESKTKAYNTRQERQQREAQRRAAPTIVRFMERAHFKHRLTTLANISKEQKRREHFKTWYEDYEHLDIEDTVKHLTIEQYDACTPEIMAFYEAYDISISDVIDWVTDKPEAIETFLDSLLPTLQDFFGDDCISECLIDEVMTWDASTMSQLVAELDDCYDYQFEDVSAEELILDYEVESKRLKLLHAKDPDQTFESEDINIALHVARKYCDSDDSSECSSSEEVRKDNYWENWDSDSEQENENSDVFNDYESLAFNP